MTQKEFNRRCYEVFEPLDGDSYQFMEMNGEQPIIHFLGKVYVGEEFSIMPFAYEPDMSDRPQALAYLKGERDDFND